LAIAEFKGGFPLPPLPSCSQALGKTSQWRLAIRAENLHTFAMTLKNAALFALVGMALLTALLTVNLILNVSGVVRGFIPAMPC
jgi:hypothetical protein